MPVTGAELIAKNILRYESNFLKSVNKVMGRVRKVLDDQIKQNLNASYFSQEDLVKLDHPYAKRHGIKGKGVPEPYFKVHQRSGKLLSSKKSGTIEAAVSFGTLKAEAYVGLDASVARYAENVVFGSSRMIPRPVLIGSKDQVAEKIYTDIKSTLKDIRIF